MKDRKKWLESRRTGIGGSDAPAVAGVSKWMTPLAVYKSKRGEITEEPPPTPPMVWGLRMEPHLRQDYSDLTGRTVRVPEGIIRHPEIKWMICTPDGLTDNERLLEIKTSRSREGWGEPGTDEIPAIVMLQVQHSLVVTALPVADVVLGVYGNDPLIYEVPADKEVQDPLIELERTFWEQCVVPGIPPEPVTLAEVQERFGISTAKQVQASAETRELWSLLCSMRAQIKTLQGDADDLQAGICAAIGEGDTLLFKDDILATWKNDRLVSRFDTEAFKKALPALHNKFMKQGEPVRRFLLKKGDT